MKIRGKWLTLLAVVGVLVVCGVALGFWTQGGSGSGSAERRHDRGHRRQSDRRRDRPVSRRARRAAGRHVHEQQRRARSTSARVTAAVHAFASHTVDATKPDCTQADFADRRHVRREAPCPRAPPSGPWSGLTVRMLDNGLNQNNCKNVTVTIDYTANP